MQRGLFGTKSIKYCITIRHVKGADARAVSPHDSSFVNGAVNVGGSGVSFTLRTWPSSFGFCLLKNVLPCSSLDA